MKNVLNIATIIFLTSSFLHAQYIPFVEEGKFWIYNNYYNSDMPNTVASHGITFIGDTTINTLDYKKVYKLNLSGRHNCPPQEQPCWETDFPYKSESRKLISLIREDTINKKVYNLPISGNGFCDTDEYLLFDFSLSVGDTLNDCIYESIWADQTYDQPGGIVDKIEVLESHGKLRNTLFTHGFYIIVGLPFEIEFQIAEGMGFVDFGIFYEPQSELADYCEGGINACSIILSNDLPVLQNEISVFPNPSTGTFQIINNQADIVLINAYNIMGQLVRASTTTNEIYLDDFTDGIYMLEIIQRDETRTMRKVMIEKGK